MTTENEVNALSAPAPIKLEIGQAVAVSFYNAAHKIMQTIAHVLAFASAQDPEHHELQITVVYPDPEANPVLLSSANWAAGYVRRTSVKHISHPSVQAGRESIAWGGVGVQSHGMFSIPSPENLNPENPIYTREFNPKPTQVSIEQAAAVQSGQAPEPTTQSPLINEPAQLGGGPETITTEAELEQEQHDAEAGTHE